MSLNHAVQRMELRDGRDKSKAGRVTSPRLAPRGCPSPMRRGACRTALPALSKGSSPLPLGEGMAPSGAGGEVIRTTALPSPLRKGLDHGDGQPDPAEGTEILADAAGATTAPGAPAG